MGVTTGQNCWKGTQRMFKNKEFNMTCVTSEA